MSTEWEQDLQEFIDLRAEIKQLKSALQEKLILECMIELLVAAGHITEDQVEKTRKLVTSLTPKFKFENIREVTDADEN